jgi:hypothetical protein
MMSFKKHATNTNGTEPTKLEITIYTPMTQPRVFGPRMALAYLGLMPFHRAQKTLEFHKNTYTVRYKASLNHKSSTV